MQLYKGDCLEVLKEIPDGSVDVVVADPPYYKVVNERWDFQWRTEDEYIGWCREWLTLVYRALRVGGSFYLFGYFKMLALLTPFLTQLGFSVRQEIVIDKGMRAVAGRATKNYRMFPNTTERLLFLVKDNIAFSRNLLKERQRVMGLTSKQINEALGVKSNGGGMWSIYTGKNVCEQFPTREVWERLEEVLDFKYPYELIAQTFNPQVGFNDVWSDIDFYSEKRLHPTQKPLKLVERIVCASSNEGDVVLDLFMGSGSTGVACKNLNRNFIGIEKDEKYFEVARGRLGEL